MRLPGRIAAAIEVLSDLEKRKRPVSEALREWGQSHRFAGSGDRAAIGNLVYDAQRKKLSHAFTMQSEEPRALVFSVAVRDWQEPIEALQSGFAEDRFAPDALSADEISSLTAENALEGAPDHIQADVPDWLVPQLQGTFGDKWLAEGQAFTARPPLDMRVNAIKSSSERVAKSLKRFSPQALPLAPNGLRIPSAPGAGRLPNVQADEGYQKGWFEIQDEGSQIAALLAGARAGEHVLDFCAGAGGKTLALASAMNNKGQIFAHDSDRNRLAPIYDRIKRAGAHNVQVRPPEPEALTDLVGRMDRVIVDAPCTGTGTWRRHPDSKWRLSAEQLEKRMTEQAAILRAAAPHVKPGGELIYITCSVLQVENQQQIQQFVEESGLFEASDAMARWVEMFPDAKVTPHHDAFGVTLSPRSTGTDGFYVSVLVRKKS